MENEYPILDKLKARQSSYSVPDDYFERLNKRLMDQTKHIQPTARTKQPLIVRMRPLLYMAAMFAGAFVIIKVASDGTNTVATTNTTALNDAQASEQVSAPVQLSSYSFAPDEASVRDYTIAYMDDYSLYEYYCETSMGGR